MPKALTPKSGRYPIVPMETEKQSSTPSRRKRPGHQLRGRVVPRWVRHSGPFLISLFAVMVGWGWTSFLPSPSFASVAYIAPSVGWMALAWWWIGVEPIPGKRKAKRGLQGNWLVPVAGLALTLVVGTVLNAGVELAAAFAWMFFGAALKLTLTALLSERFAFCGNCATTRWFQRHEHDWYCPRCGHKLVTDSTVRLTNT